MFTFINISHWVIGINLNIHILKNKTNVCGAVKHISAFCILCGKTNNILLLKNLATKITVKCIPWSEHEGASLDISVSEEYSWYFQFYQDNTNS